MGDNGWARSVPGTDAQRGNGTPLGSVHDSIQQPSVPNGGGAQYKTFAGGMSQYAMPMYRNNGGYVGQHGFPVPPYSGAVPPIGVQAFSAAAAHMAGVNPLQQPGGGAYGAPSGGMHPAGMMGSPTVGYSPPYLQQWSNVGAERNGTMVDPNRTKYTSYDDSSGQKEREETWKAVNPVISLQDAEKNMNTAYACDFVIDEEGPEERGILPPDADKSMYAVVRNIVLNAWRSNVSAYLSEKQAVNMFPDMKMKPYAVAAWRFLNSLGYINFGVADELQKRVRDGAEDRGSVVVIGAGCAGIATARQLRMKGYKVVILEGRDRPGGRVHTEGMYGPMGDDPKDAKPMALADLGGSILTGIDGNPLAVIAKQMKIPLSMIKSDNVPIYLPDGQVADKEIDTLVESLYNAILHESDGLRHTAHQSHVLSLEDALESLWKKHETSLNLKTEEEKRTARVLFDWHLANLEFANASLLRESSLLHWDQDDPHELPGPHCFAPGMNGRWIKRLVEDIPVFYDSIVSKIKRHSDGVKIYTESKKVFLADAVVVTTPLGVLKRGKIQFDPPLSHRKTGAIRRLGFGNLNKVIMLFHKAFWDTNYDIFGHANEDQELRGDSFMFYSYAGISGGAQLTALCSGEAAQKLEARSPEECANRVLEVLRKIYEPKGIEVPPPLHVICTRWGSDPMAYGAYSSMPVGSEGGIDYDILGENIHGRIYFAGEATNRKFPATMHGAFYTGLWTAANIDATFKKLRFGVSRYSKKHALMEERADDQSRRVSPKLSVSMADRLLLQNARLNLVFNDPDYPPPLIFCDSSFKCVPGKEGTRFQGKTLLCIDPIMLRGKQDAIHIVVPTYFVEAIMVKPIHGALEMVHDKYFKGKKRGPTEEDMRLVDDFVDEILRDRRSNGRRVNQEFLIRKMYDLFQT